MVRVLIASGRKAPSNAKSRRNVRRTLRPDSRFAFRRQVRQTHRTHRTQGIIFADVVGGGRVLNIACFLITESTKREKPKISLSARRARGEGSSG